MSLFFVDAAGREGRITDGFLVDYDGSIAVEKYVERIVAETASEELAIEELILGMVADLDVDEVRREESTATSPHPPA